MQQEFSRFRLRPLEARDAPELVRHLNNVNIARNLTMPPFPFTTGDAEWFIQWQTPGRDTARSAIEVDGVLQGVLGYGAGERAESRTYSVGYWLAEEYWGRGMMTEAASWLVARLLEKPEVLRVEAGVYGWNAGSRRVLEKAGLEYEATLRKAICKFGEVTDLLIFSLVK